MEVGDNDDLGGNSSLAARCKEEHRFLKSVVEKVIRGLSLTFISSLPSFVYTYQHKHDICQHRQQRQHRQHRHSWHHKLLLEIAAFIHFQKALKEEKN